MQFLQIRTLVQLLVLVTFAIIYKVVIYFSRSRELIKDFLWYGIRGKFAEKSSLLLSVFLKVKTYH